MDKHSEQREIYKVALRLKNQGKSAWQIADELHARGYKTERGFSWNGDNIGYFLNKSKYAKEEIKPAAEQPNGTNFNQIRDQIHIITGDKFDGFDAVHMVITILENRGLAHAK